MIQWAMIDLETLGTLPDCQVLTVAGLKFDPNAVSKPVDEFYFKLNIDEQYSRSISESTMAWWEKQPEAIILDAFSENDRTPVKDMLLFLRKWAVGVDAFWSQGTFDYVILENLYREHNIAHPWAFWQIRDSRTVFKLLPEDPRKKEKFAAHNALEDCRVQARCLQRVIQDLDLKQK
jgi:hypothetical protein